VHLGLAAKAVEIGQKLPLIGADGPPQGLIIGKNGAESEGEDGGHLEAVSDNFTVVDGGFLDKRLAGVVFTDNNSEITGGIEENLISGDAGHGFERYGFAVTEKIGKSLFFAYAVGIPRHRRSLHTWI
jgi:hypothetical protein